MDKYGLGSPIRLVVHVLAAGYDWQVVGSHLELPTPFLLQPAAA